MVFPTSCNNLTIFELQYFWGTYEVCPTKNETTEITQKIFIFQEKFFLRFLNIIAANLHALVAALKPPLKGGGEVLNTDRRGDPLPGSFKAAAGDGFASQPFFHSWEKKKVGRGEIWRVGGGAPAARRCYRRSRCAPWLLCAPGHCPSGNAIPSPPDWASSSSKPPGITEGS